MSVKGFFRNPLRWALEKVIAVGVGEAPETTESLDDRDPLPDDEDEEEDEG